MFKQYTGIPGVNPRLLSSAEFRPDGTCRCLSIGWINSKRAYIYGGRASVIVCASDSVVKLTGPEKELVCKAKADAKKAGRL